MRTIPLAALGLAALAASAALAQGSGGTAGQGTPTATTKSADQLICRRVEESGSLARRPRRCYTRAQWDRLAEDSRNSGAGANTGSTSGN